ncbi:MAG: peptidoglycan hydrolase, partial [Thermomicrobiaceae bacterium]|nr:peptidoglycan hydrolase [Thermomicrobiaceae bacterium]
TYLAQYFPSQRLEYHPDLDGTPYAVQIGRLGYEVAERAGLLDTPPFQPIDRPAAPDDRCTYFPTTSHQVCGSFRDYWAGQGLDLGDPGVSSRESLALWGYPISEAFSDPATGLKVQYFERAVFEYHPESAGTPDEVRLWPLGTMELRQR